MFSSTKRIEGLAKDFPSDTDTETETEISRLCIVFVFVHFVRLCFFDKTCTNKFKVGMMHGRVVKDIVKLTYFCCCFTKSETNILFLLAKSFKYALIAFHFTEFKVVIGRGNQSPVSVCCLFKR